MPELPEIETVTRQLVGQLRGRRFVDVSLCRRDFVHGDLRSLVGTAVSAVSRRGKLILVDCGPHHLLIHLGMSGRLAMADPSEPLPRHTHWRAYLDNDQELRHNDPRRFGGAWVVETACLHEHPKVVAIAPDPFQMSHREFHARLKHSRRAIKVWLMDQKQLGGVGNIYADEALFVAKIHPRKRTARLTPEQTACLLAARRASRIVSKSASRLRSRTVTLPGMCNAYTQNCARTAQLAFLPDMPNKKMSSVGVGCSCSSSGLCSW